MNRGPIAEAFLALQKVRAPARQSLSEVKDVSILVTSRIADRVDTALAGSPRRLDVVREVSTNGAYMRSIIGETTTTIIASINDQLDRLKDEMWSTPLTESEVSEATGQPVTRRGGHLRDFTVPGEPDLPPGFRYEPTPLLQPGVAIDVDFARQGVLSTCYIVSAINAVAQWDPDVFTDVVKPDPDDETFVIVTVHGGTYRLPATLPVDENGNEAFSTSPDGSTVVPYLEKAAAAHFGSWKDLEIGSPIDPMWWLVGDRFAYFNSFSTKDMPDADVHAVMTAGAPTAVTIPTGGPDGDRVSALSRLNVVEGHGYTVRNDHPKAGYQMHNPWLVLHPNTLEPRDLRALGAVLIWAGDTEYKPLVPVAKEDLHP